MKTKGFVSVRLRLPYRRSTSLRRTFDWDKYVPRTIWSGTPSELAPTLTPWRLNESLVVGQFDPVDRRNKSPPAERSSDCLRSARATPPTHPPGSARSRVVRQVPALTPVQPTGCIWEKTGPDAPRRQHGGRFGVPLAVHR